MGSSRRITVALVGLVVLVVAGWFLREALSDPASPPDSGLPVRALSELPAQAGETWRLIESDGPFPYEQDGDVFGNRERLLPEEPSDYYHEYTVDTPGSQDRGARRLVTGGDGELYYTADHYRSFVAVDPEQ
ncbi:ribonuclease N [Actinophytocola xinjiangensis]|uniref:Ribonuclease N n=1 Tax=Actinophytocola xinjiangensis TaxID=485602 RepID=A0A7Z1AX71_9PSEU|nr:ribonuclease domain-containing protein [Actinophytocola xinjiangensis]OLF08774.1 ribonuclease N [Actinophytocola xinjiangensis]